MAQHLLFRTLRSFSKREMKEFGEFIRTGFFNNRKAVKQLFDSLKKHYPDFESSDVILRKAHSEIFPGKKFNIRTIRVLAHYLLETAKTFLTIKKLMNDKHEFAFHQITELSNRNLIKDIGGKFERQISELDLRTILCDHYHFQKYKFGYEKLYYLSLAHSGVFERFLEEDRWQSVHRDFYIYGILNSMRLYLNILNMEIIYSKRFEKKLLEKTYEGIQIDDFEDNKIVLIFYYLIKIIRSSKHEEYYAKAKKLLKDLENRICKTDLSEIYVNLKNYCKRRIAEGSAKFLSEEFAINKAEIKSETYMNERGEMPPVFYRNAVKTALIQKKFDWAVKFINKHKHELPEPVRESSYLYSLSLCSFERGDYGKSLEFLSAVKFEEAYQKVEARILQIMIYYELDSDETLRSSLEAFRHFIKNNKLIPEKRKIPYTGFYRALNKLISIKKRSDVHDMIRFMDELKLWRSISNREWLVNKANTVLSEMEHHVRRKKR
jgi:hypothetical protein